MIEYNKVKQLSISLDKFDYYETAKDEFVNVTQWANGEGFDIQVKDKYISLSFGELAAINFLVNILDHNLEDYVKSNRDLYKKSV